MNDAPLIDGLYVHVPFCDGKCHYCAFYSVPYSRDLGWAWLEAVRRERDQALERYGSLPLTSIFIGGGTPSLLPGDQLEELLSLIRPLDSSAASDGLISAPREWTCEVNPGSLTVETLALMKSYGVNRISLGVQATTDPVLRQLGRRHAVADIHTSVKAIQGAGITNWGLDLIACIPGVTASAWRDTLSAALAMRPGHISVYALTREEGTRLDHDCVAGTVGLLDDHEQLRMLEIAESTLVADGFDRYEISNYARPGGECRHNLACWRGHNYLGLGCAASSRVGNQRWTHGADLDAYIAGTGEDERETLTPVQDATERLIFGMRMIEGIDLEAILRATGMTDSNQAEIWRRAMLRLQRDQLVVAQAERWKLTPRGLALADYVAVELMP